MKILMKRHLAALALAALASAWAHAEPACLITRQGVAQIQFGDTFKDFKLKHPNGFAVYLNPDTMTKFLMLFDTAKARAAYQRSGSPDFDHVPFLVHFDGYDLTDKESEIADTRKLALPKDGQKVSRIEVRRSTCVTPEGLHAGMLLKDSAKQHGGLKHIEGAEGLEETAEFNQQPDHLVFLVDGAIVKQPSRGLWTTRHYRPDARITAISILPR
jgi:hypothetical protein